MGEQQVQLVREMCEAFARADWEAATSPLDADIEWDTTTMTGHWPEAAVVHGRDAVLSFFRNFLGTWESYAAEFEEYIDAGDHVIALIHDRGRGKASGAAVERRFAQLWTVRDGKVVRFRAFATVDEALRAAGA
jgi:uncharacterized protein